MIGVRESRLARWRGIIQFSRRQLQQRWLESLFIVLGLAMGVGVFAGMQAYLLHNQRTINEIIRSRPESQAITVSSSRINFNTFREMGSVPAIRLTEDMETPVQFAMNDIVALQEAIPEIRYIALNRSSRSMAITAIDGVTVPLPTAVGESLPRTQQLTIQMVTPDEFEFRGHSMLAGSTFTWDDFSEGNTRLVIDAKVASELFPDLPFEEVVGRTITTSMGIPQDAGGQWQIVGVVKSAEDPSLALSSSEGDTRLISYASPTAVRGPEPSSFYITPIESVTMERLAETLQAYFDHQYSAGRVRVDKPTVSTVNRTFSLQLISLSALALLIAAVNILNLFMARMLRRQRYTGMSIALGATRSMLFWQTAGEALLLGIVGSGIGLVFATGIVHVLRLFLTGQMEATGSRISLFQGLSLTGADAAVGLLVGTFISLIFGLYPAWLASRQEPSEALRME